MLEFYLPTVLTLLTNDEVDGTHAGPFHHRTEHPQCAHHKPRPGGQNKTKETKPFPS